MAKYAYDSEEMQAGSPTAPLVADDVTTTIEPEVTTAGGVDEALAERKIAVSEN